MNPNYNQTITLYNCLKAAGSPDKKEHWFRHTLNSCYYKAEIVRMDNGTNAKQQNIYTVRIPASQGYKPYREWAQLANEERSRYFTMSLDDIVIHGNSKEEITGVSGQAAAQVLNRCKPDAFRVTAISDNTKIPYEKHYRLGG